MGVSLLERLGPADAAVFETFVVPRYLAFFGQLALSMMIAGPESRVVHLGCRTGYPDQLLLEQLGSVSIVGVDASHSALELARNKAAALGEVPLSYVESGEIPTPLEPAAFSHALCLHPIGDAQARLELYRELYRLLYTGGQALVSLPLRGSFLEIGDLLREYALKFDDGVLGGAVEQGMVSRNTIETLAEEMEEVGFRDVDVEIRQTTIAFDSGRAFMEDPVSRLLILPELRASFPELNLDEPLQYVRDAIDRYWSENQFELSLSVGCASARKLDQ